MNRPNVCKECGGKCCREQYVDLTEMEYKKVQNYLKGIVLKKVGTTLILSDGKQPCPALNFNGCKIPYHSRPLTCRLFPYIIVTDEIPYGVCRSTQCPMYKSFPKDDDDFTPRELEELKQTVKKFLQYVIISSRELKKSPHLLEETKLYIKNEGL
jgi:Fe-S-cluster containining protein